MRPPVESSQTGRQMALRVAFNATPRLSPLTGIGNYIEQLGAALAATGSIDAYAFYRYRWRHQAPLPPNDSGGAMAALVGRTKRWLPFRGALRLAAHQIGFARGLRRHAIDIYHEPNYVPISYDVPVVVTVHDLSWLRYPDAHPVDRVRWLERGLPKALDRAGAILVDSAFVRGEVLTTFNVDPRRVHVAHLGVSAAFRPRTAEKTMATLHPLDLAHRGYVLTLGTIEPRKNIGHVLAAYAALPAALRARYPLVVAGAKGWRAGDLEKELHVLASRGQVRFLGHVPADALPDLFAGAAAFVFPSLYEGFGLPPLEAMASGVPVLVSDRSSLPEVTGDAGVRLDPEQPLDTAAKLAAVLDDPVAHAEWVRRGLDRAKGFSWDACARATLAVYGTLV